MAAPPVHDIDPARFHADPYPDLAVMRANTPIVRVPQLNAILITRRELLTEVWELPNHPNTRVVDNVIVALRKAFEENSWRPRHIHSVRGVGYRFVP